MPRQYFELKGISYIEFSTEIRCVLLGKSSTVLGIFENVNSKIVQDEERQRRDKMKSSHEAKVERDKASRQLQLQRAQERKEKEKKRTQKQERRR